MWNLDYVLITWFGFSVLFMLYVDEKMWRTYLRFLRILSIIWILQIQNWNSGNIQMCVCIAPNLVKRFIKKVTLRLTILLTCSPSLLGKLFYRNKIASALKSCLTMPTVIIYTIKLTHNYDKASFIHQVIRHLISSYSFVY